MSATPSERELLKVLRKRDKEEAKEAVKTAAGLNETDLCPACAKRKLEASHGPFPTPPPFFAAPPLRCPECGLKTPPRPTFVGRAVGAAVAGALVVAGMLTIFAAQEADGGQPQLKQFGFGGGLFVTGMWLWNLVNAAFAGTAVGADVIRIRRGREQGRTNIKAGVPFEESLRELVFAAVLYLLIRQFALEAFVIPTGSMAPTLLGNHVLTTCTTCGREISYGVRSGVTPGQLSCPTCRQLVTVAGSQRGGDKILVNKFLYKLREADRYEVFVFKFPKQPWVNYIKRVVGLPGERLEIRGGDLYVNGKLARKPDHIQDSIWMPVYEMRRDVQGLELPWVATDSRAAKAWGIERHALTAAPPPDERPVSVRFRLPIKDFCPYNPSDDTREHYHVPDVRVRAVATAAAGAEVRLAAVGRQGVAAVFRFGEGEATFALEVNGVVEKQVTRAALAPDRPVELGLAWADDRARVLIGGRVVDELTWEDPLPSAQATQSSSVELSVAKAGAKLEQVRIERDIYYLSMGDVGNGAVTVPEGCYYAMGDNSSNSQDSRYWGFVDQGHLMGRAVLVWWPPSAWRLVR